MSLFTLILYVGVVVCLPFVAYTTFTLIKWSKNYKLWTKQIMEEESGDLHLAEEDEHPKNLVVGNFIVSPINDPNKSIELYSIIKPSSLFVFLDKSCAFCNGNFEDFISLHKERGFDLNNLIIFFERSQLEVASTFSQLYESSFSIYLTENEDLRKSLEAPFLPIYAQINSDFQLILRTPSPIAALHKAV
ncbi:hypothetical protein [Exiguobacterium acetylicum]|uniref:hypothetical protein n=1 Tax=Exiguobacterium acetylicum TaxID=41170 RepID=UPI001CA60D1A|nr:hypothetical protein [Exiguobacterium acetylicum]QZY88532.1 hypothetical protein K7G97_17090 [Exiguobacterium acetylicum]